MINGKNMKNTTLNEYIEDQFHFVDENVSFLECKEGENAYLLSKLCVNSSSTDPSLECIQNYNDITHIGLRKLLGIWSIIVGGFGVAGNLLTLLAIPYAARRKR